MSSGAMQSNVGNSQVYNDGDQRTSKGQQDVPPAFEGGQQNSHNVLDSKDQRSLANTLAAAEKQAQDEKPSRVSVEDHTAPAERHGNEPSRGAKIDKELHAEEEELMKKKGSFGPSV